MIQIILTVLVITLIFGLLVGIHEFGHFLAAKLQGVWVQEFAFGFGPKIVSKKIGDTVYRWNLIPLGGYVKLFGEQPQEMLDDLRKQLKEMEESDLDRIKMYAERYQINKYEDEAELRDTIDRLPKEEISRVDKNLLWVYEMTREERINNPRKYSNKSVIQKIIIVCAGVMMNFVLGVFVYYGYIGLVNNQVLIPKATEFDFAGANQQVLSIPGFFNIYNPEIDDLLREGDANSIIIKVNNEFVTPFNTYSDLLAKYPDSEIVSLHLLNLSTLELTQEIIEKNEGSFFTNLDPKLLNRIYVVSVEEESFAEDGGILPGMIIQKINDVDVIGGETFSNLLEQYQGTAARFQVVNPDTGNSKEILVNLGLQADEDNPILGVNYVVNTKLGTEAYYVTYKNPYLSGFAHSLNILGYQLNVMGDLFTSAILEGEVEEVRENVGGIIRIGSSINSIVEVSDVNGLVNMIGLLSLTLALMNILPLPVLDGGHLVLLVIEGIRGKPLSPKSQGIYNMIGIVLILILTILVTINDIIAVFFT